MILNFKLFIHNYFVIWGGFSVNNATLNRFFALHFVLPIVLAALALMHLIALHDSAGSGNPLGVSGNYDRLPFAPYSIFKDLITIFIFILVLSMFVFFMPNLLGDSENYVMANPMQTPPAIVPEWYLLPFYAILRSIPNKLLGVIAMFSAILILLVMPFTDLSRSRGTQFKPLSRAAFFIFVGNFLILMELGAKHVESPFIEFGQICTVLYFAHFLVTVPLISLLENSLTELSLKPDKVESLRNSLPNNYLQLASVNSSMFHVTKPLFAPNKSNSDTYRLEFLTSKEGSEKISTEPADIQVPLIKGLDSAEDPINCFLADLDKGTLTFLKISEDGSTFVQVGRIEDERIKSVDPKEIALDNPSKKISSNFNSEGEITPQGTETVYKQITKEVMHVTTQNEEHTGESDPLGAETQVYLLVKKVDDSGSGSASANPGSADTASTDIGSASAGTSSNNNRFSIENLLDDIKTLGKSLTDYLKNQVENLIGYIKTWVDSLDNINVDFNPLFCDAPRPWGIYFQDSATPQMEALVELHDNILFYLVIILFGVGWLLISIVKNYTNTEAPISHKYLSHGTLIELIWTITPALILILIAFPSFKLLYLMDEVSDPAMAVLAEGHQWYWSYQYPDFLNNDDEFIEFDSYLIPESDLEDGALRMLEVDNRLIIPELTHVRFIVTGADVIHSLACPALGIKCDAYPGRLNQVSVMINREGTFYGQCSEICGILHSSMPIVIESVSIEKFVSWLQEQ